jgi:carbonic anhydrase/acetyltransferase-like protein (isoleucine patch superfamily)
MAPLFTRHPSGALVACTATFVSDIAVSAGVNVWFSAVVRGDVAPITLGENVNLQDGVIVHCDYDVPQVIEAGVVAGHAAVLHGRRVGRDTLVGIGAKLLAGTDVGEGCVIAAGAVVPPNAVIPPRSLVMGIPGKVVRSVSEEEVERTRANCRRYRVMAERYLNGDFG